MDNREAMKVRAQWDMLLLLATQALTVATISILLKRMEARIARQIKEAR